jgi:cell division transport system permease protein
MKNWLRQHTYALRGALTHLRDAPGNFSFNVFVVAIALALPIAGLTLLDNLKPVASQLSIEPELSVFTAPSLPTTDAQLLNQAIQSKLSELNIEGKILFIPKDKALSTMQSNSNLADVLATLGSNPLPDAYVITLANTDSDKVELLAVQLRSIPNVDIVQIDSAWVKRLAALVNIAHIGLLFLAVTLSIVVIVVVFNATRLQVISHQAEISVSRLLGATNSFIHKPYYYSGVFMGLCAGLIALGIIALGLIPLNQAIADFAKLYETEFQLSPLGIIASIVLIIISMLLGWCGAYLSVRRQLAKISF